MQIKKKCYICADIEDMKGDNSPLLFYLFLITEEQIRKIINDQLVENELFLTELKVTPDNQITVLIDSFKGVSISQCVAVSRKIESNFDREVEDYKLEVSSAGLDNPFKVIQQYQKNIGKLIDVVMKDGKAIKGKLLLANEDKIELEEVRKIKKSKFSEQIIHTIKQNQIIKAKAVIAF